MKITYIYYPGLSISLVILILNLTHLTNIDILWIFLSLLLGWVSVIKNVHSTDKSSKTIFFPLIRKIFNSSKT